MKCSELSSGLGGRIDRFQNRSPEHPVIAMEKIRRIGTPGISGEFDLRFPEANRLDHLSAKNRRILHVTVEMGNKRHLGDFEPTCRFFRITLKPGDR